MPSVSDRSIPVWENKCLRHGLAHEETGPGGETIIVLDSAAARKVRDLIHKMQLQWHDVVTGVTHEHFYTHKHLTKKEVKELAVLFAGPKALEQIPEKFKREETQEGASA